MILTRSIVLNFLILIYTVIGIIRHRRHVLTAWRKFPPPINANWEFPGGKRKPGEAAETALCREIQEEIGVTVKIGLPIIRTRYDYADRQILLDAREVYVTEGKVHACEGQFLRWYPLASIRYEDFPAANRGLITALNLPQKYAITPDLPKSNWQQYIDKMLEAQVQLILLRGRAFADDYHHTEQVVRYIQKRNVQVMLHNRPEWVETLQSAGVHMSQAVAGKLKCRPVSASAYFAVSCHSAKEIRTAESLQADFCVLGHINPTPNHSTQPLGMTVFKKIVDTANIPIFALGGMDATQLQTVRSCGGQGIAGIRCFL